MSTTSFLAFICICTQCRKVSFPGDRGDLREVLEQTLPPRLAHRADDRFLSSLPERICLRQPLRAARRDLHDPRPPIGAHFALDEALPLERRQVSRQRGPI